MTRTAWPTALAGDTWTAAYFNTYGRDNDLAYWAYQAAGDLVYATSSSALARLAIGAAGTVLQSNGSIPSWGALALSGMFPTNGVAAFAPDADFGGAWADIAGASVTLTLSVTCTILLLASVTGYNAKATVPFSYFELQALVDGIADADGVYMRNYGASAPRNETLHYIYLKTGIAAGSRIVKLQCHTTGDVNHVTSGWMAAIAMRQ